MHFKQFLEQNKIKVWIKQYQVRYSNRCRQEARLALKIGDLNGLTRLIAHVLSLVRLPADLLLNLTRHLSSADSPLYRDGASGGSSPAAACGPSHSRRQPAHVCD